VSAAREGSLVEGAYRSSLWTRRRACGPGGRAVRTGSGGGSLSQGRLRAETFPLCEIGRVVCLLNRFSLRAKPARKDEQKLNACRSCYRDSTTLLLPDEGTAPESLRTADENMGGETERADGANGIYNGPAPEVKSYSAGPR